MDFQSAIIQYREKYQDEWREKLTTRIAANIWHLLVEQRVSSNDLKASLCNDAFGISEPSLLNILWGKCLPDETELDDIAMFLGVSQEELLSTGGRPFEIERNGWLDSIAAARAKFFIQNACFHIGGSYDVSIEEVANAIPNVTTRTLEKLELGVELLTPKTVQLAAAALGVAEEPEQLTTARRMMPYGYPKTIDGRDGYINPEAFSFNLRSLMRVHLWTVSVVAARTKRREQQILRFMGGQETPASIEALKEMAEQLGVEPMKLMGDCYPLQMEARKREAQSTAATPEEPTDEPPVEKDPAQTSLYDEERKMVNGFTIQDERRHTMAAMTKQIVRMQGNITRSGDSEHQSIKKSWVRDAKVSKANLAAVWSGEAIDPITPQGRIVCDQIANGYGVPAYELQSSKALSKDETKKKIEQIVKAAKAMTSDSKELLLLLALAEEEFAQGSKMP